MERHRSMFLWILFTASMMWLVESRLCQDGMRYHAHTHSGIIVIKDTKSYEKAEQHCKEKYSGGHLVYILDKETDTFVKELLDYKSIAFIGLKFKKGAYRWGDRNSTVTYFGWDRRASKSRSAYTAITRTGWINQTYESYFVCQQTCEKKHEFLVGSTDLNGHTFTTWAHHKITFSCTIYNSKGHLIQLIYRNTTSTEYELNRTDSHRLLFEINPKCSSSGQYECVFTSSSNVTRLNGIMKVLCPATFCDDSVDAPTFPVSSRFQNITIKLFVWVYHKPTEFWLQKANGQAYHYLKHNEYHAEFSYINNLTTQGEFKLDIFQNKMFQFGKFKLVVNKPKWSELKFEIKGLPECPSRFKVKALDHNSVQLTWRPGNDRGTKQMFIVMMKTMSENFVVARVEDNPIDQMVLVLSNLSEATNYNFYIDVNSTQGLTRCQHNNFSVVTKERVIFLLNENQFLNKTHVLKKDTNMNIKCKVSDDPVYSLELFHDKGDKQLETMIRKDKASILSYTGLVQCNSSGRYICQVTSRSEVITKQGYIKSECDAVYCNENTSQTPRFELVCRDETCKVILCLWIYPQPSSFRLYKANEEIATSYYNISFNYLTSYTTKGHLNLTLAQRYNSTPGLYHITIYNTNKKSSKIEFDLTVHTPKKEENHYSSSLVSYIIIVASVNVIIISVIVAVVVIKLKRNSLKQEFSMTTENIYSNVSGGVEISANQRPSHFERWSLRSSVIADEGLKSSTSISHAANIAESTPRTDAEDEASDSRMTDEVEQTYANVTCTTDGQRQEQVPTKDPVQGGRMNAQENSPMSSAGNNKRTMTSHSDRQRTSNYDVWRTLGSEGDGRTLGSEGNGRTLGSEGNGRTLGSEGDWRSLESEGRKLSPDTIHTSMIRKHNNRISGRKSKSLRTSVNKYKDDPESCLIKNHSGREGLTLDSKHEEQTVESKDKRHTLAAENEEHPVDSVYKGHTCASENDVQTVDSEYKGHAFPPGNKEYPKDLEYKGYKFASENDERTLDFEYKGHKLASANDDQTIYSGYKEHTFASEYKGQTVDSDDKGKAVDSDDEGQTVTSGDKKHTVEFKNNDRKVNLKDEGLRVISDSTNDGRTISPEGLVYVSVVINPNTKKPEVSATRNSKAPYESVEYTSINYLATQEEKVDNDKE